GGGGRGGPRPEGLRACASRAGRDAHGGLQPSRRRPRLLGRRHRRLGGRADRVWRRGWPIVPRSSAGGLLPGGRMRRGPVRIPHMRPSALLGVAVAALFCGAAATNAASRPVGVNTLSFTKTSVTTAAPRERDTVVWSPAAGHTGTSEALGRRDARARAGRFPLLIFSHGTCGWPTEATYFTMALAAQGFIVAAPPHVGNTADDGLGACTA